MTTIAFDARALNPATRHYGVGVFVDRVIERIPDVSFLGVAESFGKPADNVAASWPKVPKLNNIFFEFSTHFVRRFDAYWGTNDYLPASLRAPSVLTVHDMLLINGLDPESWRRFRQQRFASSLRRADIIVADSYATAADLAAFLPLTKKKTEVVHLGVDPRHRVQQVSDRDSENPYLVMLGAHRPRKNLTLALSVLHVLRQTDSRYRLFVTGDVHPSMNTTRQDGVEYIGVCSRERVTELLTRAAALLFPSIYEGFGLPLLEAQAAGCPVIALDTPTNTEIAGEGAIIASPEPSEWVAAIKRLENPAARTDIQQAGLANVARFDWNHTAAQYRALFSRLAG